MAAPSTIRLVRSPKDGVGGWLSWRTASHLRRAGRRRSPQKRMEATGRLVVFFGAEDVVGGPVAFVLGGDLAGFDFDFATDVFVKILAEKNFVSPGGGAEARGSVDGVADDGEFEAVRRADKSMEHFAGMNANADFADRLVAGFARGVEFLHRFLHGDGGMQRLLVMLGIGIGAAEDGEDGVADKFVHGAFVVKDGVD